MSRPGRWSATWSSSDPGSFSDSVEGKAMCGIVGLLIKNPAMRSQLGALMTPILVEMAARGPESAGMAVFTQRLPQGERKYSVFAPNWDYDWAPFEAEFIRSFGTTAAMVVKGNHAILTCDQPLERVKPWLKER